MGDMQAPHALKRARETKCRRGKLRPALRTRRINGLLHVMLESLSSIQREWTATKDMHLVRPSTMLCHGIATGPSHPRPTIVTSRTPLSSGRDEAKLAESRFLKKKNLQACAHPVRAAQVIEIASGTAPTLPSRALPGEGEE